MAPEYQTFILSTGQPRMLRVSSGAARPTVLRSWGLPRPAALFLRCPGPRPRGYLGAAQVGYPAGRCPVRPDPVGSSGMAGVGPTGQRGQDLRRMAMLTARCRQQSPPHWPSASRPSLVGPLYSYPVDRIPRRLGAETIAAIRPWPSSSGFARRRSRWAVTGRDRRRHLPIGRCRAAAPSASSNSRRAPPDRSGIAGSR
jgi:hypothetical protein